MAQEDPPPSETNRPSGGDRLTLMLGVFGIGALIAGAVVITTWAWNVVSNRPDTRAAPPTSMAEPLPTVASTTEPPSSVSLPSTFDLTYALVAGGLAEPTGAVSLPGTDRLLILEREGRIRVVADGRVLEEPLLDLTDRVSSHNLEAGLLGIALHPEFATNGRLFLTYTNPNGGVQLSEFSMEGVAVDPESESKILVTPPTDGSHFGGFIAFGPDGHLWMGVGDHGGDGDSQRHGQNPFTLQGTIVRIDVETGEQYSIPPSNPFADGALGAPEVWAYGFRNPWRLAFDADWVYVADVGELSTEEINVIPLAEPGGNFGWSLWEGTQCFREEECTDDGATIPPTVTLGRFETCAVIGGPIYRGSSMPELRGHYFYADYCTGRLWSLEILPDGSIEITLWPGAGPSVSSYVTSFAEDDAGELYILTWGGDLLRIEPTPSG